MTTAHRSEVLLSEDGKLSLDDLPFRAGQVVEVIVVPRARLSPDAKRSLKGKLVRYERPTDPVAENDWDAVR